MVVAFNLDDAGLFRLELHRVHGAALESEFLVDALAFKVNVVVHPLHPNKMQPDGLACLDHDLRGLEGKGADAPLALGVGLAQDEATPIRQRCRGKCLRLVVGVALGGRVAVDAERR